MLWKPAKADISAPAALAASSTLRRPQSHPSVCLILSQVPRRSVRWCPCASQLSAAHHSARQRAHAWPDVRSGTRHARRPRSPGTTGCCRRVGRAHRHAGPGNAFASLQAQGRCRLPNRKTWDPSKSDRRRPGPPARLQLHPRGSLCQAAASVLAKVLALWKPAKADISAPAAPAAYSTLRRAQSHQSVCLIPSQVPLKATAAAHVRLSYQQPSTAHVSEHTRGPTCALGTPCPQPWHQGMLQAGRARTPRHARL